MTTESKLGRETPLGPKPISEIFGQEGRSMKSRLRTLPLDNFVVLCPRSRDRQFFRVLHRELEFGAATPRSIPVSHISVLHPRYGGYVWTDGRQASESSRVGISQSAAISTARPGSSTRPAPISAASTGKVSPRHALAGGAARLSCTDYVVAHKSTTAAHRGQRVHGLQPGRFTAEDLDELRRAARVKFLERRNPAVDIRHPPRHL